MANRLKQLFIATVVCAAFLYSCGTELSDSGQQSEDVTGSAGDDGTRSGDGSKQSDGGDPGDASVSSKDTSIPEWTPPPVWDGAAPEPIKVDHWMATSFADWGAASELTSSILAGSLTYPEAGMNYGSWWSAVPPGEDGTVKIPGAGMLLYAIGLVEVEEPIPSPSRMVQLSFTATEPIPAGTDLYFHLNNLGANSWHLVEVLLWVM